MSDIFVYKIKLPSKVKGTTVLKDGDYIIFINEDLSEDAQECALNHELCHVHNDDLYNDCTNVDICELLANT